jgi:hypothetical protein
MTLLVVACIVQDNSSSPAKNAISVSAIRAASRSSF